MTTQKDSCELTINPNSLTVDQNSSEEKLAQDHNEKDNEKEIIVNPQEPINLKDLILAIGAYCVASLAVVYFNWWLFTSGFRYPVFISWLQQVIGFGIFSIGSSIALYIQNLRPIFPPPLFKHDIVIKVAPLSASFVLCVAAANLCLQKTLISTYQVARSLTLFFILMLSYLILREKQNALILVACVLMVSGFIINSLDPATLSFYGLLFGALSSFFQALYNVLIKFTLPAVGNNNQMLLFYNVMLSSFFFVPVVLACEGFEPFVQSLNAADNSMLSVWGGIGVSGLLGTLLNMTQYHLINTTTPLTFNIVGLVKSLVQSVGGIVLVGDPVTIESICGISLSTIGSAVYARAKHMASRERRAQIADEALENEFIQLDLQNGMDDQDESVDSCAALKDSIAAATTPSTIFNVSPSRH